MKIFYQFVNVKKLTPTAGDLINELNFIETLKQFAKVQYGDPRGCDLYYVRNNPELFKKLPKPKIWIVSPYNKECFQQATAIVTVSEYWSEKVRNGNYLPWIPGVDKGIGYRAITIYQAVGNHFVPLRSSPQSQAIRKSIGKEFIIGHFGRIVRSNYPVALMDILPRLKKKYSLEFLIGSGSAQINSLGKHRSFAHNQMPYAISACDLVVLSNWGVEWEVVGSTKVLEAAACGVPVICGRSPARVEFFGENYPLFHSGFNKDQDVYSKKILPLNKNDSEELFNLIELAIKYKDTIGKELISKAERFKPEQLAKRLKPIFENLIKNP